MCLSVWRFKVTTDREGQPTNAASPLLDQADSQGPGTVLQLILKRAGGHRVSCSGTQWLLVHVVMRVKIQAVSENLVPLLTELPIVFPATRVLKMLEKCR